MILRVKTVLLYLKLRFLLWKNDQTIVVLEQMKENLDRWQLFALEQHRSTRDIAVAWRISLEQPELDMRDSLEQMIEELSDSVARLEEEIVV